MFNTVQKLDLKKFYRCEMLQQKRKKTLLDNMNSKIYYTVNKKFNGQNDFVKRKFFPLMVFLKKKMPLTVCVKNKNCITQLHFFLSKIRWPQISEEKKRKHAWHLNKNGSKGLVHMNLGQPLSGVHW